MIRQIHLNQCDSTQDVLKEQLSSNQEECVLVSCEHQSAGRGRGENTWISMTGSLCFSLNLAAHQVMSFTAIEVSVILAIFFEKKNIPLRLKWPNDLWDPEFRKCGGILIQGSPPHLLCGIGLNMFSDQRDFGGIVGAPFPLDKKAEALEIARFIKSQRFQSTEELKKAWLIRCGHLGKQVSLIENGQRVEGEFQGIGDFGEALICTDSKVNRYFNGTLRII